MLTMIAYGIKASNGTPISAVFRGLRGVGGGVGGVGLSMASEYEVGSPATCASGNHSTTPLPILARASDAMQNDMNGVGTQGSIR